MWKKERLGLAIIGVTPVILTTIVIYIAKASVWSNSLIFPAWLLGIYIESLLKCWGIAKKKCFQLGDEVASRLSAENETVCGVCYIRGNPRRIPPRLVFAMARARVGEPIELYRGWQFLEKQSIKDENVTSSFRCRRVRLGFDSAAVWYNSYRGGA